LALGVTLLPQRLPSRRIEFWRSTGRNATLEETGYLKRCRYLLHDRDKKFCAGFRDTPPVLRQCELAQIVAQLIADAADLSHFDVPKLRSFFLMESGLSFGMTPRCSA